MLFRARSGGSASAGASGRQGPSLRAPSLTLAAPTPTMPAARGASTSSSSSSTSIGCASCAAAGLHPSPHPLFPRDLDRRRSAPAAVTARASPDGVAAAAAAPAAAAAASSSSSQQQQQERQELLDYVSGGPLLASCGLTPQAVRDNADEWCALGARLALQLGFVAPPPAAAVEATPDTTPTPTVAFSQLDPVQRLRIYRYYLPVFFWVRAQLELHAREHSSGGKDTLPPPPLVLGISAPQGCGKTTLTEQLTELFSHLGYRVAGVSIDDFYLTRKEQQHLAESNPGNRLLELRGNAGSHDLALGESCLAALQGCRSPKDEVAVPRYDKSAFGGKGDRAAESEWPRVKGPLQLVLFEGWMLGFRPNNEGDANDDDAANNGGGLTAGERRDLAPVDAALQAYSAAWDRFVDSWLVVRVGDPRWVFAWRLQAEQAMRATGKAGMTDEAVADFVARYLPAYGAYLPALYSKGPTTAKKGKTLVVEVDERRSPVEVQPPLPEGLVG